MKKKALLVFALILFLFTVMPFTVSAEGASYRNVAVDALYRGSDYSNGTGYYGEADYSIYHSGKLNDGVVAENSTDTTKGQNVEIYLDGFVSGTTYLYFELAGETKVQSINAYTNHRETEAGSRGYPTPMKVYVGNSEEDISEDTFFGEAVTTDTGSVRLYNVTGEKTGTYVIFEMGIVNPGIVIALSEVEIFGLCDTPSVSSLAAPELKGNLKKIATYDVPTVTWNAVKGAVGYDVYIDGKIVAEGITETVYTPTTLTPSITYAKNTDYTKLQVVAKGDGKTAKDSKLSQSYNFFYVAKPVDLRGNPVTEAQIIIDAGHGGTAAGAVNGERREADDNLAMSLKLAEYFERLGISVALTRSSDVFYGIMARAAISNAGEFDYFLCVHRNSSGTVGPIGIETLYESGDNTDKAFAQRLQDEMMALGIFKNRGIVPRNDLGVLNNVVDSTPTILLELGFINNTEDNARYDKYVNDLALSVVKGTLGYMGYGKETLGSVRVNSKEMDIADGERLSVTLQNGGADTKLNISGSIYNIEGLGEVVCETSEGKAFSVKTTAIKNEAVRKEFSFSYDAAGKVAGDYVFSLYGENLFPECILSESRFKLFEFDLKITEPCALPLGHKYTDTECDEEGHWHVCSSCGEVKESSKLPHIDEDDSGSCDVCGIGLIEGSVFSNLQLFFMRLAELVRRVIALVKGMTNL